MHPLVSFLLLHFFIQSCSCNVPLIRRTGFCLFVLFSGDCKSCWICWILTLSVVWFFSSLEWELFGKMELSTLVVKDLMDSYPSLDDLRRSKIETVTEIPVVNEPIPYDIFYANYLVANQPVILGKWFTDDWSSRLLWLKPDGSVQWEMLTELFGKYLFYCC